MKVGEDRDPIPKRHVNHTSMSLRGRFFDGAVLFVDSVDNNGRQTHRTVSIQVFIDIRRDQPDLAPTRSFNEGQILRS